MDAIHEELQVASDNYALRPELAAQLQKEFANRTGRIFPPLLLAAAMINRRKVGALAPLRPDKSPSVERLADMNQVVGQ